MKKKSKKKYAQALLGCLICEGKPPTGKCFICGLRRNPNEYVTKWMSRYEFLKETYDKLKKYKMRTTGDHCLDDEIRKQFGSWLPESIVDILARVESLLEEKYE